MPRSAGPLTQSFVQQDTIYAIGLVDLQLFTDGCSLSPAIYSFTKDGVLINKFVVDTTVRREINIPQGMGFYNGSDQIRFVFIGNKIHFTFENSIFSLTTNFTAPQLTILPELPRFRDLLHLPDGRLVVLSKEGLHFFDADLQFLESVMIEPAFEEFGIGNKLDYFNKYILLNEYHSIIVVHSTNLTVKRGQVYPRPKSS